MSFKPYAPKPDEELVSELIKCEFEEDFKDVMERDDGEFLFYSINKLKKEKWRKVEAWVNPEGDTLLAAMKEDGRKFWFTVGDR